MYVSLDKDNRIGATAPKKEYLVDCFEFNFPQDFDFDKQDEYKIVNGELVHEPLPQPVPEPSLQEQIDDLTLVVAELVGA